MSKCWYCNEEILTGNNSEHIGICDKCYNEMFKCGNDIIGKLMSKISDLEAKLAGLQQEKIEYTDTINFVETSEPDIVAKELDRLNEKLAEKEKEISDYVVVVDDLHKQLSDKCDFCDKTHNQDKISFAVDILEDLADCSTYINSKLDFECDFYVSQKQVRDKIKWLKEGKYE